MRGDSLDTFPDSSPSMRPLLLLALLPAAAAHGQLVNPRSRNSIDYLLNMTDCTPPTPDGDPCIHNCSNLTGAPCVNGQASYWYSQGCFIGCPECDHRSGRVQTDLCGLGAVATNNGEARSVNLNATPGSADDIYRHNPWRAPGSAPVADACGLAGGTPWGPDAKEHGWYTNTTYAHHGMRGTDLPRLPTREGARWPLGGEVEVSWNVRNNHGGGYSYRLCAASAPLTEACFQATPLQFVRERHAILFANGTTAPVAGVFVTEGTTPPGSEWARLPIPATALGPRCIAGPDDTDSTPFHCEPWEAALNSTADGPCAPCPETAGSDCSRCGNSWSGVANFAPPYGVGEAPIENVLDVLRIPSDLPAGDYVLGWRYDCEATAQVWSNCADVTLVAA